MVLAKFKFGNLFVKLHPRQSFTKLKPLPKLPAIRLLHVGTSSLSTGFELPEEDREDAVESELPHLPPDKDPQAQTLTRPQPKKKAHNKEMVRRDSSDAS